MVNNIITQPQQGSPSIMSAVTQERSHWGDSRKHIPTPQLRLLTIRNPQLCETKGLIIYRE